MKLCIDRESSLWMVLNFPTRGAVRIYAVASNQSEVSAGLAPERVLAGDMQQAEVNRLP